MPPKILFYADPDLKTPHNGNLKRVAKGETAEITIYCVNRGDGTLFDPSFQVLRSINSPMSAEVVSKPPSRLAPGERCEVKLRWTGEGKWGARKAYLDVEGEHVD